MSMDAGIAEAGPGCNASPGRSERFCRNGAGRPTSPPTRPCAGSSHGGGTVVAELGGLSRGKNPKEHMAYQGLAPSEPSSGASVRRGRIIKTGNGHTCRGLRIHPAAQPPKNTAVSRLLDNA